MSNKSTAIVVTMRIDIGKNSFHVVCLDRRDAIGAAAEVVAQVEARLANLPPCLNGKVRVEPPPCRSVCGTLVQHKARHVARPSRSPHVSSGSDWALLAG